MEIFLQQIINGLTLGSVYALVALGYTMVYGIIGLINFAHGEVVMVGALTRCRSSPRSPVAGLPRLLILLDRARSPRSLVCCCSTTPSRRSPTGRCATRRGSRR